MKRDKAVGKALEKKKLAELPSGFSARMMKKICMLENRRRRRVFILNISLVSITSLGLILLAAYLLRNHLQDIKFSMPDISTETVLQYRFGFYIASLMLILAVADYYVRDFIRRKKTKDMQ